MWGLGLRLPPITISRAADADLNVIWPCLGSWSSAKRDAIDKRYEIFISMHRALPTSHLVSALSALPPVLTAPLRDVKMLKIISAAPRPHCPPPVDILAEVSRCRLETAREKTGQENVSAKKHDGRHSLKSIGG